MRRILGIVALALVGLAIAVGVTMTTSSLSSQTIGISGEPITAGQELAVPAPAPRTTTTTPRTTDTQPRTVETPDERGSDDDRSGSGGDDDSRGRGRGRGRGGDDGGHADDD